MLGREPGGLSAAAYDLAGRQAMSWSGRLLHIHIAKRASLAMEELDEAKLVAGRGIEGDRYFYGTGTYSPKPDAREVTLMKCSRRSRGAILRLRARRSSLRPQIIAAISRRLACRSAPSSAGASRSVKPCSPVGG